MKNTPSEEPKAPSLKDSFPVHRVKSVAGGVKTGFAVAVRLQGHEFVIIGKDADSIAAIWDDVCSIGH